MKKLLTIPALILGGCSSLKDAAIGMLTGDKGGIQAEATIAGEVDNSTNIGETQNISAEAIQAVVDTQQQAFVIQNDQVSMPLIWLIVVLIIVAMIFLVADSPRRWKIFRRD